MRLFPIANEVSAATHDYMPQWELTLNAIESERLF